jgi:hypothetical protein
MIYHPLALRLLDLQQHTKRLPHFRSILYQNIPVDPEEHIQKRLNCLEISMRTQTLREGTKELLKATQRR